MTPSQNITANVGAVDGLELQENGTERLKGSYSKLVTFYKEIREHLYTEAVPLLESLGIEKVSRVCCRYFVTESVIKDLKNLDGLKLAYTTLQIEVRIPLGKIFKSEGVEENIWWVWMGANAHLRKIGKAVNERLAKNFQESVKFWKTPVVKQSEGKYLITTLGTKERVETYKAGETPNNIPVNVITDEQAKQIAHLFAMRLPVYVAQSSEWHFIKNEIANSEDIVLFALIDTNNNEVVACAGNEYCRYPVTLPNGHQTDVLVCESNDWVKRRDISHELFISLLSVCMKNAVFSNPHVIETECIREAFRASGRVGFEPVGLLERTSHMVNDGENAELYDTETEEKYRKFNSLWLYTITPNSPAWEYWKIL